MGRSGLVPYFEELAASCGGLGSYVDLDQEIPVVDLTNDVPPKADFHAIAKEKIMALAQTGKSVRTYDGTSIYFLANSKFCSHIAYSSQKLSKGLDIKLRNTCVHALQKVITGSLLVTSHPSTKTNEWKDGAHFYSFYAAARVGEVLFAVRLVAEKAKKSKKFFLYDVLLERQKGTLLAESKKALREAHAGQDLENEKGTNAVPKSSLENLPDDPSFASIRHLLTGVKGIDGKFFVNPDGTGHYQTQDSFSIPCKETEKPKKEACTIQKDVKPQKTMTEDAVCNMIRLMFLQNVPKVKIIAKAQSKGMSEQAAREMTEQAFRDKALQKRKKELDKRCKDTQNGRS